MTKVRTKELEVKCLDLHNQILHRPDTYIGGTKPVSGEEQWVYKEGNFSLSRPTYSLGLLRIFVEVLSNAIDNVWRSQEFGVKCKKINVEIDYKTGETTVKNDGKAISTALHKEEKKYIPELIFSRLLTSTNYDDTEDRKTSGKNGYGVKLTSIFSKSFTVELYNSTENKKYTQSWSNNMKEREEPIISSKKTGESYTQVSWIPDFARFYSKGYDPDIISIYRKHIYDTAMIVAKYKVKVYYNDELVPISSLKDYALMYLPKFTEESDEEKDEEKKEEIITFTSPDSEVVVLPFSRHLSVSFVNGICTAEGGVHNDVWCEAIFRPILEKINKTEKKEKSERKSAGEKKKRKSETPRVDIREVKERFAIFILCELTRPEFVGQNKSRLLHPVPKTNVKLTDTAKMMKWSAIENLRELLELKDLAELKVKKRGFIKVEGLEDANYAKKATKRQDCILTISEGLSAKTYIVGGMKYGLPTREGKIVSGRDYIGVLPLRGKFINPRGKSITAVAKNKEVLALIKALGLEVGVDYTLPENLKNLRYGRFIAFTDTDVDGFHIIGLLYNFFNALYPSILQVSNYFCFARTPIIKLQHRSSTLPFYYLEEAREFIKKNKINKEKIKYYKGLGTSTKDDVATDFGKRIAHLVPDAHTSELIDNIFNSKKSEFRKNWIQSYDPSKNVYNSKTDNELELLPVKSFINYELISFSIDDCKRSIPNMLDGLKESQRKILYATFKRNLKYSSQSLKVAQLAGYVAEHTNYHHGENNLLETIRGMAQRFVGSNNMPLLLDEGAFGSRLSSGKDGASGRYIFTKLEVYTRELFPEDDDVYLENIEDDGDVVEKKYYLPIIPMILVNGAEGIGTGFSTNLPSYNPLDLITWIQAWIKKKELPRLLPWYRNFKGEIKEEEGKIITFGVVNSAGKNKYKVSELPVGRKNTSIEKFRTYLEDLLEKKRIKDFDDYSDDNTVDFLVTEDKDGMNITLSNLGLTDTVQTNNMVLFDKHGVIKRYSSIEEILQEFCKERLELYATRRKGTLEKLKEELKYTRNKIKFIKEVSSDTSTRLILKDKTDKQVCAELEKRKFDKKDESYEYLLNIKIRSLSKEKITALEYEGKDLECKIKTLEGTKACDIWVSELVKLYSLYTDWMEKSNTEKRTARKK